MSLRVERVSNTNERFGRGETICENRCPCRNRKLGFREATHVAWVLDYRPVYLCDVCTTTYLTTWDWALAGFPEEGVPAA